MSAPPEDTSPEAWAVQTAVWRRMGPARRLELALKMSEDVRAVFASGVRSRHPDYTEAEVRWVVFRRYLGDALFRQAFPDAPLLEP